MSMKRTKQRSGGSREKDVDGDFWKKPADPDKTWEQHMEGQGDESFLPYAMTSRFAKGHFVSHAKFGKGVVVDADAGRVEILFQDGKKKLGHGQAT